jgi:ribose-phosphate pyrophosphokinase
LDSQTLAIFTGNANPALAQEIARHLMVPLGRSVVGRFSDGEVNVELMENVRGRDVFLIQPTCPPVNDHLMELLVMADACRRASVRSVTAVVPYMGYSRQDRRPRATRSAISAKLVANMMTEAASTACSRSTCTPSRSRGSSTSPSTTSTPRRCCSATPGGRATRT